MPVYVLTVMKSHVLKLLSNQRKLDVKIAAIAKFMSSGFTKAAVTFYPRLYHLKNITKIVGRQKTLGDETPGGTKIDWGFFTDEHFQALVKPKIIQST